MSKHPIWEIGLFKKLSDVKAECLECKETKINHEFTLSKGSIKSLQIHLESRHKNSEYLENYNKMMASKKGSKSKNESNQTGGIDNFVVRSSGI